MATARPRTTGRHTRTRRGGERPAESDVESCRTNELLAFVVAGASDARAGLSPADTATALLDRFGGAPGLARACAVDIEEVLVERGMRPARAVEAARVVAGAFELARRAAADGTPLRALTDSKDVAAWATPRLGALEHEELWLLALDGRSRLRAARCVAKGGLHGLGVRAADPLRHALRAAASGFVLVHNHPSGDPTPSTEDVTFTRRVADAAAMIGVPLLDHVVVAREGFASVPFPAAAGELG